MNISEVIAANKKKGEHINWYQLSSIIDFIDWIPRHFRLTLTHFNFSCCFFIDSDDATAYLLACGLGRESHTFLHSLDLFLLQYGNSITKVKTIEKPQAKTCMFYKITVPECCHLVVKEHY